MGYPKFNSVREMDSGAQPFENYLTQIHLLYPNIPEMYLKYLEKVYTFDSDEFYRLLTLNETDIANTLFTSFLLNLERIKIEDYALFTFFVESYDYKNRMISLFEIETGGGGEVFGYVEQMDSIIWGDYIQFKFSNLYEEVLSVSFDEPFLSYTLLKNAFGDYEGVEVVTNDKYKKSISVIAFCSGIKEGNYD